MRRETATFIVNGRTYEELVPAHMTLLELLRDRLGLTGTKRGCSASGNCGACTVLLEGKPVLSCLTLAWTARDRRIITVEGLAQGGRLHPVQQAFLDAGAVQCGFCTPGMLLSAAALLDAQPDPTPTEVRRALAGNLCRCTGYVKIVEAVLKAAAVMRSGKNGEAEPTGETERPDTPSAAPAGTGTPADDAAQIGAGEAEECESW